ncbi:EGF factor, partial [Amia calva]|nr:EGF factor [Amia calva]
MNGTKKEQVYSLGKGVSGFAVDWIQNNVIWTNHQKGNIERAGTDGKNARVLLQNLSQPSGIIVDPNAKFIFWISDGRMVHQANLEGEMTTTVFKTTSKLQTLTLDVFDKRLFWVQSSSEDKSTIGSCDYNGNFIQTMKPSLQSQPLWMSVFLEHIYFTDGETGGIKRENKYTGKDSVNISGPHLFNPPAAISVVHPLKQPSAEASALTAGQGCDVLKEDCTSVCSRHTKTGQCECSAGYVLSTNGNFCEDINECSFWNHGCTLGCVNIPGSYFCTCPQGFVLLPDMKTCHELVPCTKNVSECSYGCIETDKGNVCHCPEGSVLRPDGKTCSGCSSPDNGGCSQLCVMLSPVQWECACFPGYSLKQGGKHCAASGKPFLLFTTVIDIWRINLDGKGYQSLLQTQRGRILALDFDPVASKVYFANTALKWIERANLDGSEREVLIRKDLDLPEGLAVDWINRKVYWTDRGLSRIECSDLNGNHRQVIISQGVSKPRGITVHPLAKKLFWTDMGERPRIEASSLDGADRFIVANTSIVSPSGLTIDYTEDKLYWCDNKRSVIEVADLDGSNRRIVTKNDVGRPFDLAVFEDFVWFTDWAKASVMRVDKRTGQNQVRLHGNMLRPSSMVVVHPLAKPGADPCLHRNGECRQLCESRSGLAHCSCYSDFVEAADGRDCQPIKDILTTTGFNLEERSVSYPRTLTTHKDAYNIQPSFTVETGTQIRNTLVTEQMISDQHDCSSLRCEANAKCFPELGGAVCQCLEGFSGDGEVCVANTIASDMTCFAYVFIVKHSYGSGFQCVQLAGDAGFVGITVWKKLPLEVRTRAEETLDIDECRLGTHKCDAHADCVNAEGTYVCRCITGYTGMGFECEESIASTSEPETASPPVTTTHWQNNLPKTCPPAYETYCLYGGVCFYIPDLESYACNCVTGYMGERCQFSDLEWWELQHKQDEQRRSVTITVCMASLVSLLAVAACGTYCYG